MRSGGVVVFATALDQHFRLLQRREDLAIQKLVAELRVQAFAIAILPRASRFDVERLDVDPAEPLVRTLIAINSGPLSERTCSGGPCATKRLVRQWSTSSDLSRLETTIARHRRVNSSGATNQGCPAVGTNTMRSVPFRGNGAEHFHGLFFDRVGAVRGKDKAGEHFVAVTDPGSSLERRAEQLGFTHIFHGVPSIGGRYSVLSKFGSVPAAAIGLDVKRDLYQRRGGTPPSP